MCARQAGAANAAAGYRVERVDPSRPSEVPRRGHEEGGSRFDFTGRRRVECRPVPTAHAPTTSG